MINNNTSILYFNPYTEFALAESRIDNEVPTLKSPSRDSRTTTSPKYSVIDEIHTLAEKTAVMGKTLIFKDYESELDFIGKSAGILDLSAGGIVGGMQGALFLNSFSKSAVLSHFIYFSPLLKAISPGLLSFSIILGGIEEIFELVQIYRSRQFLDYINKQKEQPLDQLLFLKDKFFSIDDTEEKKITLFIEKNLSDAPILEKAARFDLVAEKILALKFASLARRITPRFAIEVKNDLPHLITKIESLNSKIRQSGIEQTQYLMESISKQSRKKIINHTIGLCSVTFSLISITFTLIAITNIFLAITLGCASLLAAWIQIIHKKNSETSGLDHYHSLTRDCYQISTKKSF